MITVEHLKCQVENLNRAKRRFDMVEISRVRIGTLGSSWHRFYTEMKGRADLRWPIPPTSSPPMTPAADYDARPPLHQHQFLCQKFEQMGTSRRAPGSAVMVLCSEPERSSFLETEGTSDGSIGWAHLQIYHWVPRSSMVHEENVCQLSIWLHPRRH